MARGKGHLRKDEGAARCEELREILIAGWPNCLTTFFNFFPGFLMLSFLGEDADELAAGGMAFMLGNVTGMALIVGFGAGAGPLISQAYGAANFSRCGDLLQRQFGIHLLVWAAVVFAWANAESILVFFQQPTKIAKLTGLFLSWRLWSVPFLIIREDMVAYLVSQQIMMFPMVVSVLANVVNIALFPVLIGMFGFIGAPLAMNVANTLQASLMLMLGPLLLDRPGVGQKWSCRIAFSGWGELLKMSVPGGVLMLCEWMGWETNLFFAGLLCAGNSGCAALDVFPIVSNTMVIAFMVYFGFSIAAQASIGNALGAGDGQKAWRVTRTILVLAASMSFAVVCPLLALRRRWGRFFTNDAETVHLTRQVMPMVAAYIFLDALGPGALVAILRGIGYVRLPAVINFIAFYGVGIPFGLYLTFGLPEDQESWGVFGLWTGLTLGMFIMVFSLLCYVLFFVDWHTAASIARSRSLEAIGTPKKQDGSDCKNRRPNGQTLGKKAYSVMGKAPLEDRLATPGANGNRYVEC